MPTLRSMAALRSPSPWSGAVSRNPRRPDWKDRYMAKKEPTYDETQITEKLKDLPGWYLEDGWIRRVYKTDGWPTTLMLVNSIGYLAEAAYHHPDLSVTWGRI